MRWSSAALSGVLAATAAGCKFPELPAIEPDGSIDADGGVECVPNTTTCTSSTLIVCDAAGQATISECSFGCFGTGDRCADLAPSNDLGVYLDQASSAPALALTGNATIDTDSGTVTNGDGSTVLVTSAAVVRSPVAILAVSTRSMSAMNLRVTGTRALAILAHGDVELTGVLSVSAARESPGPGAPSSAPCTWGSPVATTAGAGGGGGGSYGTLGGAGGSGAGVLGGLAGSINGTADITPLRGGCGGGLPYANFAWDGMYRAPGGGGGAIQISTRGRVVLNSGAFITANGGGAKAYVEAPIYSCQESGGALRTCHSGAGGGSGGAVLIEAAGVALSPGTGITSNGGAGHCGSHGAAPDGSVSAERALGTAVAACTSAGAGHGGDGAAVRRQPRDPMDRSTAVVAAVALVGSA